MRIAVGITREGKVAGHLGKCVRWQIFEWTEHQAATSARPVAEVRLPRQLVFHYYQEDQPHPLDDCAVIIGSCAGERFMEKMQRRGITPLLTAETSPENAVRSWIENTLPPPKPRPVGELVCKLHDWLSPGH